MKEDWNLDNIDLSNKTKKYLINLCKNIAGVFKQKTLPYFPDENVIIKEVVENGTFTYILTENNKL